MTVLADPARASGACHPADAVDEARCAATVFAWLVEEGPSWDPFVQEHRPEMGDPRDTLRYTMEGVADHAMHAGEEVPLDDDGGLDPASPHGRRLLDAWCAERAATAAAKLRTLRVEDGMVRAHRVVATDASGLRPSLGIFWTHSLRDCVDIYPMWSPDGRESKTAVVVEAMIPVEAVDWDVSCMALMDWYFGDAEQELRVAAGFPVRLVSCRDWRGKHEVVLPDLEWTT